MIYIKKVHIEGYKKFKKIDIDFNERKNLIVGDNGSGKSTILEALNLTLNHNSRSFDLSLLSILFNLDNIKQFEASPSVNNLPKILIQVFFGGMDGNPNYDVFYGPMFENNSDDLRQEFGVEFKAQFDDTLGTALINQITSGHIPYEYYKTSVNTFGGVAFRPGLANFGFFLIDSSNGNNISLNSYSKMIFKSLEDNVQLDLKNEFSVQMKSTMTETMKKLPPNSPCFFYNIEKTALENIVELYEQDLPISSLGKGNEAIIKITNLIQKHCKAAIVAIEEPENHLSYSSMNKMIELIQNERDDKQLIITSHSNRIASGIGLNNVIGLSKNSNEIISLSGIPSKTANYFKSLPSDNMLQFLLSKKVILVEGPAETIYMNKFYNKLYSNDLEHDDITCISVNGLSFKHYIQIAQKMKIRVCVITDNDNNIDKFTKFKKDLKDIYTNSNFEVFSDLNANRRTFEICLYNDNKQLINDNLNLQDGAKYEHDYSDGDRCLGRMLNDKTGTALELINTPAFIEKMVVPQYIKDALEFIREKNEV